jgi:hypothetical protein
LRAAEGEGLDPMLLAEARLLLVDSAILEKKKSEALKQANLAMTALGPVTGPGTERLRALALAERARALSVNRDFPEAVRSIRQARLAYGQRSGPTDAQWHRLLMLEANIHSEAGPDRISREVLDDELESRLGGGRYHNCQNIQIERVAGVGAEPAFPGPDAAGA